MLTEYGKNLSVLIITEPGQDWQTFATWYSVFKNLPESNVAIASIRNNETPFQLFQWTKRLNIPLFYRKAFSDQKPLNVLDCILEGRRRKLLGQNILVMESLTMVLEPITKYLKSDDVLIDDSVWLLKNPDVDDLMNECTLSETTFKHYNISLCPEVREAENLETFVSCKKGCGRWIHNMKGCPFSNAAGMVSEKMTINENRVIELWKRLCSLYSVVK